MAAMITAALSFMGHWLGLHALVALSAVLGLGFLQLRGRDAGFPGLRLLLAHGGGLCRVGGAA